MKNRRLLAGVAGLCLIVGVTGVAVAAVPSSTTVKESQTFKFVPNRYIQDGLRFNKDVYKVKSGGKVNFVFNVTSEGPHTLTIVNKGQDGNGTTVIATRALTSGVNSTDYNEDTLTLSVTAADLVVADGDIIAFVSTHSGSTGLADPGGLAKVLIARS